MALSKQGLLVYFLQKKEKKKEKRKNTIAIK
jgi:hypothetical protein